MIKLLDYIYIYYAVRCLYTWHMYTVNCLLLHFMLSYYQVMFWPAGLLFRANLFRGDLQEVIEKFPGRSVWRGQIEARQREGLV